MNLCIQDVNPIWWKKIPKNAENAVRVAAFKKTDSENKPKTHAASRHSMNNLNLNLNEWQK